MGKFIKETREGISLWHNEATWTGCALSETHRAGNVLDLLRLVRAILHQSDTHHRREKI